MTSPREAVSILTAAALVVAPVGGVAATYTTGYADNGDGHTVKDDRDHDIPANYEEALVWIKEGKTLYKSCVDYMAGHADKFGGLTEAQRAELWSLAVDDEPTVPESEMTAVSEPEPEPVPAPVETTPESEEPAKTPAQPETPDVEEPVVPEVPADPDNPEDPTAPVDPADPVDPAEPTDPVEPVEPTEPGDPVDPVEPTDPAEPTDPTEPTDPVDPAEPVDPVDPTDPTDPEQPAEPDEPIIDTDNPVDSGQQKPGNAGGVTDESHTAAVIKGQAQAPNNNLFGIKGTYHGNSVQLPTREDDGTGATYTIMSDFRQYETVDESLSDYADLLSHSMGDFYAGARKSNSDSFVDACDFLVGRYATDIFYSEKLQDLIETYDLTRFDVPLTYELADTFVLPVKDEVTGLDKYLDPVTDKVEYEALVAEYRDYVARTSEYQQALAEWGQQMAAAEELYHVPVYLEKPSMPAADTPMQQHQDAIDAERFEGFDTLIATGQPLPVREARTLNDLTACANSFLGVPYLWGGTTPAGFDCSGLVQYCYREVFNIELPRTTYYQCEVGVEVPFEELLPGDLLFFADGGDVHHVAMYLGDGYYVEAPHTGDVVKITAMNDKLPDFAKRVVDVRSIDMSEFSDEQLAQFVEREKYLQEREQRLGVTDETLAELTEWLRGLEF